MRCAALRCAALRCAAIQTQPRIDSTECETQFLSSRFVHGPFFHRNDLLILFIMHFSTLKEEEKEKDEKEKDCVHALFIACGMYLTNCLFFKWLRCVVWRSHALLLRAAYKIKSVDGTTSVSCFDSQLNGSSRDNFLMSRVSHQLLRVRRAIFERVYGSRHVAFVKSGLLRLH